MKAIDGEELMDRVDFILSRLKSTELVSVFQNLKSYLENAPTLTLDDLRPKGRWIGTGYDGYADGCLVYDLWECSECRAEFGCVGDPPPYEFCPSCGADMRGGEG